MPKSKALRLKEGFPWHLVAWGKPSSPRRPLCSLCHGMLDEAPLMLWAKDGSLVQLCDPCVEKWVEGVWIDTP